MRAVNLLPRDLEIGSKRSAKPVVAALVALVALTALAGVLGMQASAQADGQRADLALTEAAIARIPVPTPQPAAPDVSVERSNRIAALQSALSTRVPVDKLLGDLSFVVPDDVWLTGLTVSIPDRVSGQAAPATAGEAPSSTVTIEGATYSQPAIARFLARLNALSSLGDVQLTESARVEPQTTESSAQPKSSKKQKKPKVVVTFTVTAGIGTGLQS